jgi:hypothetical protein
MIASQLEHPLTLQPKQYEAAHSQLIAATQGSDISVLKQFTPHSLVEQNTAALMNRMDSKYLLPISFFNTLMLTLANDYSILAAYGKRIFNYQTTYFDNKNKKFYLDHHNGKLNRYKIRFRRYVESNMGFIESKYKNNKKRTIKLRIPMDCTLPDQERINKFVKQTLGYATKLETALFVNYHRITLLNKQNLERITIDLNLSFRNAVDQKQSIQNKVFIVEIKQENKKQPSVCDHVLKKHGYHTINFSKYCMGTILTTATSNNSPAVKYNRFKPVMQQLKKLNTHP